MLNNAISGVDQALWDIKGRQAGMPVYQLAGGKCREAADCYAHADGADYQDVVDSAQELHGAGIPPRARAGGRAGHGRLRLAARGSAAALKALHDKPLFEPRRTCRRALKLFEVCRKELGDEVELLHDMHERVTPNQAVQFCKDAEKFKHVLHGRPAFARRHRATSARSASSAPRPSPWASCSTARTSGRR